MRTRMLIAPLAPLALVALTAAARPTVDAPASRNDAPRVVTIKAGDYFFDAPDVIEPGMTTFRLVAAGKELHHVTLVRLEGGHTLSDLLNTLGADAPPPKWAIPVGGPNAPAPGGTFVATLDLPAGNYALLCFIPGPDGKPHVMKGMARSLTVKGRPGGSTPKADVSLRLADYDFGLNSSLPAGHHIIRVENTAQQPHEMEIVKLAPGKSAHDFVSWIEKMDGPPPGLPIGGVTPMAINKVNFIEVDLTPGHYALICFAPDAKDGKPHFVHGMIKEIDVK